MSSNSKQRLTLSNLSEPQQMRELNRQLSWIWDQLLGGLSMKSLSEGARKVIDSKATQEDVESAVSQSAEAIILMVRGLNAPGVDTGEGGGVQVLITKDFFNVDVPGEDGDFRLNADGGWLPVLVSQHVSAPDVAVRYDGPAELYIDPGATGEQLATGRYYRSLSEACAAISGRNLEKNIHIILLGDVYGDAYLIGICGIGSVIISGGGFKLTGKLYTGMNTVRMEISNLTVTAADGAAVQQTGPGWIRWLGCTFIGRDFGLSLQEHAAAYLYDCSMYGAEHLLYAGPSADVVCNNIKGSGGTNFLYGDGGNVKWYGTRPDGALRIDHPILSNPADLGALAIDYGEAQPGTPETGTISFDYLHSDSYRGGWNAFEDEDIRQGYNGEKIYGAIWFDNEAIGAALNTKSVKQASLRLYMMKGVGRGVPVEVRLCGTGMTYERTGSPEPVIEYGVIGSARPGEINEMTIPAEAVNDLASDRIKALCLLSGDETYHNGAGYSRNYARFAGSTSADAENYPRLTVIYQ